MYHNLKPVNRRSAPGGGRHPAGRRARASGLAPATPYAGTFLTRLSRCSHSGFGWG